MERVKVSVDDGYARWARGYDAYPNPLIVVEEPLVRGLLAGAGGARVLDVACGTGRHALWLAGRGARVTALDRSGAMLSVARGKEAPAGRLDWLEGDAASLPFADRSFDVVLNALLMEHVEDIRPALAEARRVLVPGGALVLSVYHPSFLLKGVPPHFALAEEGVELEMPGHVHLPSEYVTVLIELGMRLTHLVEPLVDDALIARRPNMEKHRGLPLAIVLRAVAPPSR